MRYKKLINQFYRILPTSEVDSSYLITQDSHHLYEPDESKPYSFAHFEHPLKSVVWTGQYGVVRLYAVRLIDTYMLSINKRSRLYYRSEDIYKALTSKKVIPATSELAQKFKNFQMLDLEGIAVLSDYEAKRLGMNSEAKFIKFPAYDWAIEQTDIHIEKLSQISTRAFIPCLHEDKVVEELFLESGNLDGHHMATLIDGGFKDFSSSYIPSYETINEWLEDIPF